MRYPENTKEEIMIMDWLRELHSIANYSCIFSPGDEDGIIAFNTIFGQAYNILVDRLNIKKEIE